MEGVKLTKARLRKIYLAWEREEVEAIDLIEAVGAYLGVSHHRRKALGDDNGEA